MDSKKLSIGTEDFEKLRLSDSVYIDKTSYLTELYGEHVHSNGMSYVDEVLLFTRPRRFGKSLTMSMIENFFELNYADPEDKSKPKQNSVILLYPGIKPSVKNTWGSFLL